MESGIMGRNPIEKYEHIIVEKADGIGKIIIDRPKKRNAMARQTALEMTDALKDFDADPEIRVIVLTHTGDFLTAGGDLEGYTNVSHMKYRQYPKAVGDMWWLTTKLSKPVIGSIKGNVLGGGVGVIANCDLVVMANDVYVQCAEINIGMWPMVVTPVLMRSIGRKHTLEMMMTGDRYTPERCREMGLVNYVCDRDDVDTVTKELCDKLASKSPLAMKLGREVYYNICDMEYGKAIEYTAEMITLLCNSHDGQEGVKAFFSKTKPNYTME